MCFLIFSLTYTVFKSENTFKKLYHITIHLFWYDIVTKSSLKSSLRLENNSASHILFRLHLNSEIEASLLPLKPRCHFLLSASDESSFHLTLHTTPPISSNVTEEVFLWKLAFLKLPGLPDQPQLLCPILPIVFKPFWIGLEFARFGHLSSFRRCSYITGVKMRFGEHLCH